MPYSKYIKPGSVILDIGANVGLFSLHVAPYIQNSDIANHSSLICVEPTPAHMEIQKELFQNNMRDMAGHSIVCSYEQAALNNYTGRCRFHHEPVNTTMNTIRPDGGLEVDCITLLDLCNKYNLTSVDFCKVDIEGSEWQALSVDRIKEVAGIIKAFFVELHPRTAEAQRDMAARFEEAGYKVEMIDYNGSIYCTI